MRKKKAKKLIWKVQANRNGEEEFELRLKDRYLSENLLSEFVADRADVILVVVDEMTYN